MQTTSTGFILDNSGGMLKCLQISTQVACGREKAGDAMWFTGEEGRDDAGEVTKDEQGEAGYSSGEGGGEGKGEGGGEGAIPGSAEDWVVSIQFTMSVIWCCRDIDGRANFNNELVFWHIWQQGNGPFR
jgi:hypothetical protein